MRSYGSIKRYCKSQLLTQRFCAKKLQDFWNTIFSCFSEEFGKWKKNCKWEANKETKWGKSGECLRKVWQKLLNSFEFGKLWPSIFLLYWSRTNTLRVLNKTFKNERMRSLLKYRQSYSYSLQLNEVVVIFHLSSSNWQNSFKKLLLIKSPSEPSRCWG